MGNRPAGDLHQGGRFSWWRRPSSCTGNRAGLASGSAHLLTASARTALITQLTTGDVLTRRQSILDALCSNGVRAADPDRSDLSCWRRGSLLPAGFLPFRLGTPRSTLSMKGEEPDAMKHTLTLPLAAAVLAGLLAGCVTPAPGRLLPPVRQHLCVPGVHLYRRSGRAVTVETPKRVGCPHRQLCRCVVPGRRPGLPGGRGPRRLDLLRSGAERCSGRSGRRKRAQPGGPAGRPARLHPGQLQHRRQPGAAGHL